MGPRQKTTQENDVPHRTIASIGRFAGDEAHDLGNTLVAIAFCLKQLRGRQSSGELEELVERALEVTDQGVESTRTLLQATRRLLQMASYKPEGAKFTEPTSLTADD